MQYINNKWLTEPDKYYPEPKTICNAIKWHIALADKAEQMNREINHKAYKEILINAGALKPTPEADKLIYRDQQYIASLGYENVALIEAAMLLGRELYYMSRNGYSDYDEEIESIGIRDLKKWMEVFEVPPTIEAGGNLAEAVEYTLSKRTMFLQAFIDSLEGSD